MVARQMIQKAADAYFLRNKEVIDKTECSAGMRVFSEFYDECRDTLKIKNMLEIGCCTGYNLMFMNKRYGITASGIEPSPKAVEYGKEKIFEQQLNVEIKQGFADRLPYADAVFDLAYLGFCMYQVDRETLFYTLAETDRVVKWGGICVITDFDTPVRYVRENIHNKDIFTYKADYSVYLAPYGYTLIYKKMYSHNTHGFEPDVQERLSTQIFYKEKIKDIYVKD